MAALHRIPGILIALLLVGCGSGSSSSPNVQADPDPANAPAAPTGVAATPGDREITVSWISAAQATFYNVYWGTMSNVTPASGTRAAATGGSRTITGLTNGVTYYFTVAAVNANGEGDASGVTSAIPVSASSPPPAGWTPQILINEPFDFFDTDLYIGDVSINDQGQAAAAWVEESSDSDTARLVVNRYAGAAWGVPETLATDGARSPAIVITPLGDIVVCYTQRGFDVGGFMLNETVWSRRYANGAWSAAQQIDNADLAAFVFMYGIDLIADANGNVMAAWVEDNTRIWAARFEASSGTWSAPVLLSTSIRTLEQPALGVDGAGAFMAVWLESTEPFDPGQSGGGPSRPVLKASQFLTGSWTAAQVVGHNDLAGFDSAERAALAINADGTAVAVWEQVRNPGAGSIWSVDTVRFMNGNWGAPESIVSQSTYTSWPDIAIDGAGNATSSWQPSDPADGSDNVAAASFYDAGLGAWDVPRVVNSDITSEVDDLFVGRGAFGASLAVWRQTDVMIRRYDASGMPAPVESLGTRTGQTLAFASSPSGHAIVITDHMIMNSADWRRSVWANVYSP